VKIEWGTRHTFHSERPVHVADDSPNLCIATGPHLIPPPRERRLARMDAILEQCFALALYGSALCADVIILAVMSGGNNKIWFRDSGSVNGRCKQPRAERWQRNLTDP
jgi:hypothetical protein